MDYLGWGVQLSSAEQTKSTQILVRIFGTWEKAKFCLPSVPRDWDLRARWRSPPWHRKAEKNQHKGRLGNCIDRLGGYDFVIKASICHKSEITEDQDQIALAAPAPQSQRWLTSEWALPQQLLSERQSFKGRLRGTPWAFETGKMLSHQQKEHPAALSF